MFDSPLSASAYEVLGVVPGAEEEELRRAYRLRLRLAHPDTGGDALSFVAVQRAWELIGTPEARAAYDSGHGFAAGERWRGWDEPETRTGSRLRATSYGRAGGWHRRRYLALAREWAGAEVSDPYDPAFVRQVPKELRRLLADALAEEETARTVSDLGMGFTIWHDVATGPSDAGEEGHKLDHIVLGPTGAYGVSSLDLGGIARFRGGEIIGPDVGPRAPVTVLLTGLRAVARTTRVRFGGGVVAVPDDALAQAAVSLGTVRGVPIVVTRRSALATMLRGGVPGGRPVGGNELFDMRTRLQQAIRFA
ncbi:MULTISPECIES: DnaJ domain-containing protein [Bacteria]|uniref:DnaJ domain-containing protein n=1 Tax=Bacteria TaxID=2 RepID=UPI003C7D24AF